MDLEPGHSLGRYRIEAKLGKGGFGSVYAAYDTLLQRRVALKVLSAMGDERARLVAEARAAARLVHPNVVTVHEVESEGDVTYLVMELVPGATLRKRATSAPLAQKIEWLAQIADALAAAHTAGLVHRDVKPDNVVIGDTTGTAKVLDFGIAKAIDPPATLAGGGPFSAVGAPPPTATGRVVGTLRYMAPEQLLGHPVEPTVDQWAWGVLAYEVLSGQHPGTVAGATTPEEWILLGHTRPLDQIVPGLPPHVSAIVSRALAREARARFASMVEVAAALRAPTSFHASPPTAPTNVVHHAAVPPSFSSGVRGPTTRTGHAPLPGGGAQDPLPPPHRHGPPTSAHRANAAPSWRTALLVLGLVVLVGAPLLGGLALSVLRGRGGGTNPLAMKRVPADYFADRSESPLPAELAVSAPGRADDFDPIAAVPWATSIATQWRADAQLSRIGVDLHDQSGKLDLTAVKGARVEYRFWSPKGIASYTHGGDVRPKFGYEVALLLEVRAGSVRATRVLSFNLGEGPSLATPSACDLRRAVAALHAQSKISTRPSYYDASLIDVVWDGEHVPTWYLVSSAQSSELVGRVETTRCTLR